MNNQNNNNQTSNNDLFSLYGGSSVNTTNNPENSNTNINLANMNNNPPNVIPTPNINSANPTISQQPIESSKSNNIQEMGSSINQSNSDIASSISNNESGNTNSNNQQEVDKMIGLNFNNPSSNSSPMPSYQPKQNIDYDALLVSYVGPNYDKISRRKFSFSGFFFGLLYVYYRKMYLYAFLFSIISCIIGIITSKITLTINMDISWAFYLVMKLILAFAVNSLYRSFAKRKVRKIVSKNPNLTMQELATLCEHKGGRSIGAIFLGIFFSIVILIIMAIFAIFVGISNTLGGLFGSLFSDFTKASNGEYAGMLIYRTDIDISSTFNVTFPDGLTDKTLDTVKYQYNYEYRPNIPGVMFGCDYSLGAVSNFSDASFLATSMAEYYSASNEVEMLKYNNVEWRKLNNSSSIYYLTEKNGIVYIYEYDSWNEEIQNTCDSYNESILNSISFK